MHKELLILGLLQDGPKTGYDIHRFILAHGELYTDLKKGNVYYLLDRLAGEGLLRISTEAGARGPRRERLIYALTEQGRESFMILLRDVLRTYELAHTGVEVGIVFLPHLPIAEAITLLDQRRQDVIARRKLVARDTGTTHQLHEELALDHLSCLMDAEIAWIDRAIAGLRQAPDHGSD